MRLSFSIRIVSSSKKIIINQKLGYAVVSSTVKHTEVSQSSLVQTEFAHSEA